MSVVDFGPVESLGFGQREGAPHTYIIQARMGKQLLTVALSEEQAHALSFRIPEFLVEVHQKFPEIEKAFLLHYDERTMSIDSSEAPLLQAQRLVLGYEPQNDLVVLAFEEGASGKQLRFWCTREQILQLALWMIDYLAVEVWTCPLCYQEVSEPPMEHVCPRTNGAARR